MAWLSAALDGSRIFRPWTRMARYRGADALDWLGESRLVQGLRALTAQWPAPSGRVLVLLPYYNALLILGVLGLFTLCTVAETGLIGAAVALLFVLAALRAPLFQLGILGKLTVIDGLVALFLASAVLSTAFSSYVATSLVGLAKMGVFVAGYIVFRCVSEMGTRPIVVVLLLLCMLGLGESFIGFYQHAHHIQPLATWSDPTVNPELQMDRIFGTLKPYNPNLLAGFLIPCLAASAGLGLKFARRPLWPWSIMLLGVSVCILVALVWTGSRGGFLAIGVMMLTLFAALGHLIWYETAVARFRWLKPAWLLILLGSVAVLALGIASSEKLQHRVASIFAMREDSSISYRLNVYHSVTEMIQDNPVVGIGPGNGTFKQVYGLYMVPGYNALGAYSVPLEIMAEQGLIGLVIFLSLLLVIILRAMYSLDSHQSLERKLLIATLLTGILGSFTYGLFDTIWYRPAVNLLFWFFVAAFARLTEPEVNAFRGTL